MPCRDNQYHPERVARRLESTVDCFACGHAYTFVGDDTHPGECPRCESRAVSPAGTLDVDETVPVDPDNTSGEQVTVYASDATGREYACLVAVSDGQPRLQAARVAGANILPTSPYWGPALRFDAVERAVAEYVDDPSARLEPVAQERGRHE